MPLVVCLECWLANRVQSGSLRSIVLKLYCIVPTVGPLLKLHPWSLNGITGACHSMSKQFTLREPSQNRPNKPTTANHIASTSEHGPARLEQIHMDTVYRCLQSKPWGPWGSPCSATVVPGKLDSYHSQEATLGCDACNSCVLRHVKFFQAQLVCTLC